MVLHDSQELPILSIVGTDVAIGAEGNHEVTFDVSELNVRPGRYVVTVAITSAQPLAGHIDHDVVPEAFVIDVVSVEGRESGRVPSSSGSTCECHLGSYWESAYMTNDLYDDTFAAITLQGSLRSAQVIAPLVLQSVQVNSILDIGCGIGSWMKAFAELGVPHVEGWDGSRFSEEQYVIEASAVSIVDLAGSLPAHDEVDLVICLEVAEHLPADRAEAFIAGLCRLGSTVLFSAAIPGQGGTGHLNEQYLSYWIGLFANHGYQPLDVIGRAIWTNTSVDMWYRQNVVMFSQTFAPSAQDLPLDIIHPAIFAAVLARPSKSPSLRDTLKYHLPRGIRNSVARRVPWKRSSE